MIIMGGHAFMLFNGRLARIPTPRLYFCPTLTKHKDVGALFLDCVLSADSACTRVEMLNWQNLDQILDLCDSLLSSSRAGTCGMRRLTSVPRFARILILIVTRIDGSSAGSVMSRLCGGRG